MQVNMFEAKSDLSKLIRMLESGEEQEIVVARNGEPVAKLLPLGKRDAQKRIGIGKKKYPHLAKEEFLSMENLTKYDDEIASWFYQEEDWEKEVIR